MNIMMPFLFFWVGNRSVKVISTLRELKGHSLLSSLEVVGAQLLFNLI